jgi:hypothetical protein
MTDSENNRREVTRAPGWWSRNGPTAEPVKPEAGEDWAIIDWHLLVAMQAQGKISATDWAIIDAIYNQGITSPTRISVYAGVSRKTVYAALSRLRNVFGTFGD